MKHKLTFLEKQNEILIQQNKDILHVLSRLNLGGESLSETLYEPLTGFPITTIAEFEELDGDLNKSMRQKGVSSCGLDQT